MQSSSKSLWKKFDLQKGIVYIAIVVAFLVFTILLGDTGFLKPINQVNILRQMSTIGIMCFGMVFVIGCGQIDLTVGANVAMSGIVAALVMQSGGNAFVAVLAALGTGALIGLINGGILVGTGLPSFLITIGTMTIQNLFGSVWERHGIRHPGHDHLVYRLPYHRIHIIEENTVRAKGTGRGRKRTGGAVFGRERQGH